MERKTSELEIILMAVNRFNGFCWERNANKVPKVNIYFFPLRDRCCRAYRFVWGILCNTRCRRLMFWLIGGSRGGEGKSPFAYDRDYLRGIACRESGRKESNDIHT